MLVVKEVAAVLHCTPDTVRNYIGQGMLPAVRRGPHQHYEVSEADLRTFVTEHPNHRRTRVRWSGFGRRPENLEL